MLSAGKTTKVSRRRILATACVAVMAGSVMFAAPAKADQLDDLHASGAVGEAYDGFPRARAKSAKEFVKAVNSKRRKLYIKRAREQKVSVEQIGEIYGEQLYKRLPDGGWFLKKDGKWIQK